MGELAGLGYYYIEYSVLIPSVDPDDLIFPRTTTRLGPKYQAVIPPLRGSNDPGTSYSFSSE